MSNETLIDDDAVITRSDSVLWNATDGAIVMMDIDNGSYYVLEATGARIWTLLEAPMRMASLCDALTAQFDVDRETCQRDVSCYLHDLCGKDLVEIVN
jgi:hypothetical protein